MDSKLAKWKASSLSYAGRIILFKHVLSTLYTFWASMFILPKGIIRILESKCKDFLWQKHAKKDIALVSWKKITKPREEGGFGVKQLCIQNHALIAKQVWRIIKPSEFGSIWIKWMQHNRLKHESIWTSKMKADSPWYCRGILKTRDMIRFFIKYTLGYNSEFSVWLDPWNGFGVWKNLMAPEWPRWGLNKLLKVIEVFSNGDWTDPLRDDLLLDWIIKNLPVPEETDNIRWTGQQHGKFNVLGVYECLRTQMTPPRWADLFLNACGLPKHMLIFWIAINCGLLTKDKKWMHGDDRCMFWDEHESINHLFFRCCFGSECCKVIQHCWPGIWEWTKKGFVEATISQAQIWKLDHWAHLKKGIVVGVIYFIWNERNRRLFGEKPQEARIIMEKFLKIFVDYVSYRNGQSDT